MSTECAVALVVLSGARIHIGVLAKHAEQQGHRVNAGKDYAMIWLDTQQPLDNVHADSAAADTSQQAQSLGFGSISTSNGSPQQENTAFTSSEHTSMVSVSYNREGRKDVQGRQAAHVHFTL